MEADKNRAESLVRETNAENRQLARETHAGNRQSGYIRAQNCAGVRWPRTSNGSNGRNRVNEPEISLMLSV